MLKCALVFLYDRLRKDRCGIMDITELVGFKGNNMTSVCKDIFKAIHEGKWLRIEYRNKSGEVTKYWIAINDINVPKRMLIVQGMHIGTCSIEKLFIYIDSILSSVVIDGTYFPVNKKLIDDIALYPDNYRSLFDNVANLRILSYLEMCSKLDTVSYYTDYDLIKFMDRDTFFSGEYQLSGDQFKEIVKSFSIEADKTKKGFNSLKIKKLAMNVLSIYTNKGLFPLAYRKLNLNVEKRTLQPDDEITICTEFQIDNTFKESVRKYLDADDYELLYDFEKNQELIKNAITKRNGYKVSVDDMPYVIAIGMDVNVDLHSEYQAIIEMYETGSVKYPIKAFFGDLLEKPRRSKTFPIALIDTKINLDQLLAVNKAIMYPTAYVQGPPGTGKTNTIMNTIVTAYFNEKTVLFASNNNHPIDTVFEKLSNLKYMNKRIPFPVLRLGNNEKLGEALDYIRTLMESVENVNVFDSTLDKRKDDRTERAKELTELLKVYEDYLDLQERKDTLKRVLEYGREGATSAALFPFEMDLQGRQMNQIKQKMESMPVIREETVLKLLDRNEEEFLQYLFFTSAKHIKRLKEEKYSELRDIINESDKKVAIKEFSKYLSINENVKRLQRVFPIIITTCISAHRLGEPKPIFDMTIIDEASQCNTAMSLVPIIRGENLMLVGDPQQLNPVILLDEFTNRKLKKEYQVPDEYDYRRNSIYKTFLASDSVSDEILLHNHYRCAPQIIGFNNKKYYNSQLKIKTCEKELEPLVFYNVENVNEPIKNTSLSEVNQIVNYVNSNKDKKIGIITPFANQRDLIEKELQKNKISDVACGTVHSFQGDEKDVVLFSTAIGPDTKLSTYNWLKSNRELINVATSRAKDSIIILADYKNVERLHKCNESDDDLFELINYVRSEGKTVVTPKQTSSRALGVKPFSSQTETAFLKNLNHALENIWLTNSKYVVHKEVPISQVFMNNTSYDGLFYTGRFDFVVYEKKREYETPVLAIELDGKEHLEDEAVKRRDEQKNKICSEHNLQLIRVENTYARRYNHIKTILMSYFAIRH